MRYFVASRWENMKQVQVLTENLTANGHEVFSYVKDPRNFVSRDELEKTPAFFKDKNGWRANQELREEYEKQLEGLRGAEAFVLLLPAGESSHIQAGIAFGLNKRSILIGAPEAVKTHYLVFDEWYPDIPSFIAALKK